MRLRKVSAFAAIVLSGLAGCSSDALSPSISGTYARDEPTAGGAAQHLRLSVTATGMSVTGPAGAAPVALKLGSALFKSVKCSGESTCRFVTESGCEGTLTREGVGSLVLIATGECESWSGKWGPDQGAPATTAGAAASGSAEPSAAPSAIPAAPQTAKPGATASPSGTPSGTPGASPSGSPSASPSGAPAASGLPTALPTAINVGCLSKCQESNMACVRECKVGELDCMKGCSDKMVTCAKACP